MDNLRDISSYFENAKKELDSLTKGIEPLKNLAESVLRQPKVIKAKEITINSQRVCISLFEDNSIKMESANREQADKLFNEIHLYKKTLLDACICYFKNILR